MHSKLTILLDHTDFKMHSLICRSNNISFRLFEQYLEKTLRARSKLNNIIGFMVNGEHVSYVEVTIDEFLMIRYLVQIVREVSVLALLLEWTHCSFQMIISVIYAFSSAILERIESQTIHISCFKLTSAVRVLKVWIFTHLTESTGVILFADTLVIELVVLSKSIAPHIIRIILRYAYSVAFICACHVRFLLLSCVARNTLFA